MRLDVIIPTYNRQELLQRALQSLLVAPVPAALEVRITVVDNNSKDQTRKVVEDWQGKFAGRLAYLFEGRQGRSAALNRGILATQGELVGMVDDDEEVDERWFQIIYEAFAGGAVDFIGGPYYPRWGAARPDWLPMKYMGVIGWIDGGKQVRPYDASYPGILMGGNAVISRRIFSEVGLYSTALGRTDRHLLAGEDEDMYERLLTAKARGLYLPNLIVHHYIPAQRLTKRYFRRWCFWQGVSMGILNQARRQAVPYFGGVPRYLYGEAARAIGKRIRDSLIRKNNPAESFTDELAVWNLAGSFYGKHFYKPAARLPGLD
jgi:glucosyl-dolichyl phosphate glucuronosyltransferase